MFGERISQLTDAEWRVVSERCASLNSTSFAALLERTRLGARPYLMSIAGGASRNLVLTTLEGVNSAVMHGISFAYQVAREFDTDEPYVPSDSTAPTNSARGNALADGFVAIERAVAMRERAEPGLATAVRAAGQAVLGHDFLAPDDFAAAYQYVEPVIPFASLTAA